MPWSSAMAVRVGCASCWEWLSPTEDLAGPSVREIARVEPGVLATQRRLTRRSRPSASSGPLPSRRHRASSRCSRGSADRPIQGTAAMRRPTRRLRASPEEMTTGRRRSQRGCGPDRQLQELVAERGQTGADRGCHHEGGYVAHGVLADDHHDHQPVPRVGARRRPGPNTRWAPATRPRRPRPPSAASNDARSVHAGSPPRPRWTGLMSM